MSLFDYDREVRRSFKRMSQPVQEKILSTLRSDRPILTGESLADIVWDDGVLRCGCLILDGFTDLPDPSGVTSYDGTAWLARSLFGSYDDYLDDFEALARDYDNWANGFHATKAPRTARARVHNDSASTKVLTREGKDELIKLFEEE